MWTKELKELRDIMRQRDLLLTRAAAEEYNRILYGGDYYIMQGPPKGMTVNPYRWRAMVNAVKNKGPM